VATQCVPLPQYCPTSNSCRCRSDDGEWAGLAVPIQHVLAYHTNKGQVKGSIPLSPETVFREVSMLSFDPSISTGSHPATHLPMDSSAMPSVTDRYATPSPIDYG
jgi:hypothetical protein